MRLPHFIPSDITAILGVCLAATQSCIARLIGQLPVSVPLITEVTGALLCGAGKFSTITTCTFSLLA